MGLFGGGNTKRTTINEDNRIINDYNGASFSNDSSNNGQFAGVGGNVTYTTIDGGAFDVVSNANSEVAGVAGNGLALANSLGSTAVNAGVEIASNSQDFALSAIDLNANLIGQYGDLSALMLDRTLSSVDSNMNNTATLLDGANARTLDAALNITETGLYQSQLNNNLARDLVAQNGEAALAQQKDNNSALTNGFKSMMQFADSFSRSDGANIAKSTNKTMMFFAGAAVVSLFIFKKLG